MSPRVRGKQTIHRRAVWAILARTIHRTHTEEAAMPRRRGPRPTHDSNKAPLHGLDPVLALLGAVIQQALADLRSPRPDIRQDALQFLRDEAALGWWGDVLGVGEALQQQVQAMLRDRC